MGNQTNPMPAPEAGDAAGMPGMDNVNSLGGKPDMNMNSMPGMNPNELNSVMNAVLMNNALQQQAGGMGGMMNPLVMQTMMNQGMMGQMGGMGMTNPAMGIMGMGGMGMPNLNPLGGLDGGMAAPGGFPPGMDNNNDVLAQLMQNPLSIQMISQGLNPMMLLGGMGGAMGQNQLGLAGANLGMNGLGFGTDVVSGLNGMLPNSTLADGVTAPHPNALFAFNNPAPQHSNSIAAGDGVLSNAPVVIKGKKSKKVKAKGKPKRPLSAYNFFFREERSRILDSLPKTHAKKKQTKGEEKTKDPEEKKEVDDSGSKEKNKDSKGKDYDQTGVDGKKIPHGKIGFENLAKLIGKRWKELDEDGLEKYRRLADEDMTRYKKAMERFLTKEAEAGVDGDLMSSAICTMLNQKRQMDGGDGLAKKKRPKNSMVDSAIF